MGDVANNGVLAFNRSDAFSLAGVISGVGAVQQIGSGTTLLTRANTFAGATTVLAGTLQAGAGGALSPNSDVTVAAAGTLDLNGFNQTVAGLSLAGVVRLGHG